MAASTIFFNGRLISVPGSYSEVDPSGLETIGLGATGIVALLGTAIGGKPYSAVDAGDVKGNLQVATRPSQPRSWFRSGDLKEGADMLFAPGADADVPAGAQEVVFVKVNPATKSQATFDNADGAALIIDSADYGNFTTQINVQIAAGTAQGKLLTITFEGTEETFDDVGGDVIFTLQYAASTPAEGFTTVTAQIDAARLKALFTRDQIGLDSEVSNQVVATQAIELVSSSASDVAVQVRLYGTDTSDNAQVATVTLTGTTVVTTTETWNSFHGAEVISGTLVGTLTIQNVSAASTIATIAPAGTEAAIEYTIDHPVAGTALTVVADGASTARVTLIGLSAAGVVQTEELQLNGTTAVAGAALWARLDALALGELAAGVTLTVSGTSVDAVFSSLPTIQKLADKFNGLPGYTFAIPTITNASAFPSTDLDWAAATDIRASAILSAGADLARIVAKLNSESQLVVASKGAVASGAPDNTTSAVFLTGGHEGSAVAGQEGVATASTSDWQAAIDLLTKVRVNSVVGITGDPAIHAQLKTHCEYMGGIGRSERDMVVGALNTTLDNVPSKTELKAQVVDLNTRHARVVGQAIERYNTEGDRAEFLPTFTACVIAGMQAGSPVGTSLTHKFANVLKLRQSSTWNPTDDAEELIQAGVCMLETIDGIGRRVVRNVTTHLTSSNIAFTEGSVNEAVNFSVFNFRETMDTFVGKSGFAGTVNAAKGVAVNILGLLINVSIIAWRSLDIALVLDVLEVAVEIAPVLPINFVQSIIHLVAIPQSAAA